MNQSATNVDDEILARPESTATNHVMKDDTLRRIQEIYGVESWSAGYFDVGPSGTMLVRPVLGDAREADLKQIVDELIDSGRAKIPLLLRFPQILTSQIERLTNAYKQAIQEFEYAGTHYPVFPMKVNPRREVVQEFLKDSERFRVGLECGSKPELLAGIAQSQTDQSLLLCNGFKDESFIRIAMLGVKAGKRVTVIVEKLNELRMVVQLARETGVKTKIGLRAKLYSRGSGKWSSSGGEAAKFGLTTSELLECVKELRAANMLDQLNLLHFHIGSQITDIKRIKKAIKEAARVYAKLHQIGCEIEFLDIGGGLGVDYDGSRTRYDSSVNYSVQEFANDVVYTIKSICENENVPEPNIVTESGRFMTAYHTVLVTSIRDEIETFADKEPDIEINDDDPAVIREMKDIFDSVNGKNFVEYYHDALELKDSLHVQFNLGLISLENRSKGEVLFWEICSQVWQSSDTRRKRGDEFAGLKKDMASKYLCNFSMFRSAPDSWAIDQLFPIVPIHRLNELPTDHATLVDVTCDSDGKIDQFVDEKNARDTLEVHDWHKDTPYYLGVFLTGAYQEVMGNAHNLFGLPDEAHVRVDSRGTYTIEEVLRGSSIEEMAGLAKYGKSDLVQSYSQLVNAEIAEGAIEQSDGESLIEQYETTFNDRTYLG